MADNLSSRGAEGRYPNGDPFAELSRIIGAGTAERRVDDEPSFDLDLERELLGDDAAYEAQSEPAPFDTQGDYREAAHNPAPAYQEPAASADPLDDEFADAFAAEFGDDGRWRASAEPEAADARDDYHPHGEAVSPVTQDASHGFDGELPADAAVMAEVDLDFGDIDLGDDIPALEAEDMRPQQDFAPAPQPSLEDELSAMLTGETPAAEPAPYVPLRSPSSWNSAPEDRYAPEPAEEPQSYDAEYDAEPESYDAAPDAGYGAEPAYEAPEPERSPEPDPFAVLASLAPVAPALRTGRLSKPIPAFEVDDEFATAPVAQSAVPQQDALDLPELPPEEEQPDVSALPLDADYHFGDIADVPAPEAPKPAADLGYATADPLSYEDDYAQGHADDVLYAEYAADQDGYEDEVPAEPQALAAEPAREGFGRGALMAAALVGIALIGGIGAFALSFGGGEDNAAPTLVRADSEPLKVRPENPGGTAVPNVDSQAYQRVAEGEAAAAPEQERLVTATEEPVTLAAQPVPDNGLPGVDDDIAELDTLSTPKSEDRVEAGESAAAGTDQNVVAVQPRRVRTMVVRPDGTLVPREEAPAAAEQPAPDSSVAQTAAGAVREISTAVAQQPAAQPAIPAPRTVETVRVAPEAPAPAAPAATPAPARPEAPAPAAAPQPRETQVAQAAPAQARNAPAAAAPAASGEWSMQIASQPTAEGAQSTYQDLARRYGGVLGGKGVNIVRADIPGKGTYYRVRIPSATRAEAISLCERYKSAGGSCFVSK